VTIQAQILELMSELKRKFGTAVMFITHDLGVIAEIARRVIVMYAGKIVEQAPVADIFETPCHPYTLGLLGSIPSDQAIREKSRLSEIKGMVPALTNMPAGCAFHPRCPRKMDICSQKAPDLFAPASGRRVACWLYANEKK
jgi:oligopeptide/dipeptide ABC transporter ATP-binding protein